LADDLRVLRDGPIATVVLNRPEKRNAISVGMWEAMPRLLRDLEGDGEARVVVIRGAGEEAFASGADISEFERVRSGARAARAYSEAVARAERALADFPRPTIAMIHGFCVGGGLEVALACDLRWASRTARLGITAARLGIVYSLAATRRLASVVGPSHARDLLMSGRLVDAGEALAMGLVNRVCEPERLEAETYGYARLLAQQAPLTQRGAKMMLQHLLGEGGMTGSDLATFVEQAYESDDYREGVRAFLEKRRPRFEGR
jgi:enoyl-CoA hydratase/carnithine racemase